MRTQGRWLAACALLAMAAPAAADVDALFGNFAPFDDDPAATLVDVFVNDGEVASDLAYGDVTPGYLTLGPAGDYTVRIVPDGDDTGVALAAQLPDGDYTFLLIGDGVRQPVQGFGIQDLNDPPASGAKLRFIHAAAFASGDAETAVTVLNQGGDPAFDGLESLTFGDFSGYLVVPAGTYDFKIATADGSEVLVDPAPFQLSNGEVTTLVISGDGDREPVILTTLPDGELAGGSTIDHTATGIFYDPATPGQGAQFMALPRQNRITGFFYTYDLAGEELVWYNFDSCNSAPGAAVCATPGAFDGVTAPITIYRASGGVFNDPAPIDLQAVGEGTIEFLDCDNATVTADFGNGAGTVVLDYTRLGDRVTCSPILEP